MAAAKLRPFRFGTRRRFQQITTVAYDGTSATNRPNPIQIPKVGYLANVWLVIRGTITTSGAAVLGKDGLAAIFDRVQLTTNLGAASIVDVSGPGLDVANRWQQPVGGRARRLTREAAAAQPVEYYLRVPCNANEGKNFELGLINLQDPQIQVTVTLQFGAILNVITLATAAAIVVEVWYEYFEVPDPRVFAQPPRMIVRTLEESQGGLAVSPTVNLYLVPRLGTMLQYSAITYCNSIRSRANIPPTNPDIAQFAMRFNKTDLIYTRSHYAQVQQDMAIYGGPLEGNLSGDPQTAAAAAAPNVWLGAGFPTLLQLGVYTFDFWHAEGIESSGDLRDAVDTEELTTTEMMITYDSGAPLQSTDTIRHVRRVIQSLAG